MKDLLYYPLAVTLLTAIIYGLWYLHNDHPLGAAFVAGCCVVVYDGWMNHLATHHNGLQARIVGLEERVRDLEDERDSLYD